jgi:DNA/RNA endonuclease YhcR with UshA esterase domain
MKSIGRVLLLALVLAGEVRAEKGAEETAPAATPASPAAAEVPVLQSEDLASMESQVDREVVIEGVVKSVGTGPNDGITFLNFGERRSGFVAVIFRAAYDKFPEGFDQFVQQRVRVRGTLEKYRDRQLQIKIVTPDQIEIVATSES